MQFSRSIPRVSACSTPLLAIAAIAIGVAVSGCATPDRASGALGNGGYMQVFDGDAVVFEMETAISGMASCLEQASAMVKDDLDLKGRIQCAQSPTSARLAYSALLRSTRTQSDGYYPSAAYRIRTSTPERCQAIVAAVRQESFTQVVEDKCSG